MAEAVVGFASTHTNLGLVCLLIPTFCHFAHGNKPIFPNLQSSDGLCWLHPLRGEHGQDWGRAVPMGSVR